jgi:hypothetical protein
MRHNQIAGLGGAVSDEDDGNQAVSIDQAQKSSAFLLRATEHNRMNKIDLFKSPRM